MAKFQDSTGREWAVDFDAFTLEDIQREVQVDLADLSAGGLGKLEQHAPTLVRALAIVCSDQVNERGLKPKEFAKSIRGEAITDAFRAVFEALRDFFPPSVWSEMESRFQMLKTLRETFDQARPLLEMINQPEVPESMRDAILEAIKEQIGSSDSQTLADLSSAIGLKATPSSDVLSSPENAESVRAA